MWPSFESQWQPRSAGKIRHGAPEPGAAAGIQVRHDGAVEYHQGGVGRGAAGEFHKLFVEVAGHQQRRPFPGNGDRLAQPFKPELLLRPDEGFEPGDVVRVAHVQGVEVDPGTPCHPGNFAGSGTGPEVTQRRTGNVPGWAPSGTSRVVLASAAPAGPRQVAPGSSGPRGPSADKLVAVAVREQCQPGRGAHLDEGQRPALHRGNLRE